MEWWAVIKTDIFELEAKQENKMSIFTIFQISNSPLEICVCESSQFLALLE